MFSLRTAASVRSHFTHWSPSPSSLAEPHRTYRALYQPKISKTLRHLYFVSYLYLPNRLCSLQRRSRADRLAAFRSFRAGSHSFGGSEHGHFSRVSRKVSEWDPDAHHLLVIALVQRWCPRLEMSRLLNCMVRAETRTRRAGGTDLAFQSCEALLAAYAFMRFRSYPACLRIPSSQCSNGISILNESHVITAGSLHTKRKR